MMDHYVGMYGKKSEVGAWKIVGCRASSVGEQQVPYGGSIEYCSVVGRQLAWISAKFDETVWFFIHYFTPVE